MSLHMKVQKIFIAIIVTLLVVIIILIKNRDQQAEKNIDPQALSVPMMTVELNTIPDTIQYVGNIVSDEHIAITSRIAGYIQKLAVNEGSKIEKNDLLIEIDPSTINQAIAASNASLIAATKDFEDALKDLKKIKQGIEDGWAAKDDIRKARLRVHVTKSMLDKAKAANQEANAQSSYVEIKSPINGAVISVMQHEGDMSIPGAPIIYIEGRNKLYLKTYVAESEINFVKLGTSASVTIESLAKNIIGITQRIVPSIDPVTRRYEVQIALPECEELLPGMFGKVEIEKGQDMGILIPSSALIRKGGLDGVFVVDRDARAHFRWVRVRRAFQESVEVTAGLNPGENILIGNIDQVQENSLIKPEIIKKVKTNG